MPQQHVLIKCWGILVHVLFTLEWTCVAQLFLQVLSTVLLLTRIPKCDSISWFICGSVSTTDSRMRVCLGRFTPSLRRPYLRAIRVISHAGMSESMAWRSASLRAVVLAVLLALGSGGPRPEHRTPDHSQREQADWTQRIQYPALNDAQHIQYPSIHDTQQVQFPSVDDAQVKRNIIVLFSIAFYECVWTKTSIMD